VSFRPVLRGRCGGSGERARDTLSTIARKKGSMRAYLFTRTEANLAGVLGNWSALLVYGSSLAMCGASGVKCLPQATGLRRAPSI
jgi:hypothetical protein